MTRMLTGFNHRLTNWYPRKALNSIIRQLKKGGVKEYKEGEGKSELIRRLVEKISIYEQILGN